MKIVIGIIQTLLSIAAVITFLWMVVGIPVGIIGSIFYFLTNDKGKKSQLLKWIKRGFASILVLVVIGIIWIIIVFISNFLGVSTLGNVMPFGK